MGRPKTKHGDPPTAKQAATFNYILSYTQENLFQPSLEEIAEAAGAHGGAAIIGRMNGLEAKGYIDTSVLGSRRIKLVRRTPFTESEIAKP